MRTITSEEYERIPRFRKSMEYSQIHDWSHRPERRYWVNVRIGDRYAACDPKYLPEENKMQEMTSEEWFVIPKEDKSGFFEKKLSAGICLRTGWIIVYVPECGFGICHGKHAPVRPVSPEITIAVWSDGEVRPISVTPETHIAEAHANGLVCPTRYEVWTNTESIYRHLTTRRVEMRPVVLP